MKRMVIAVAILLSFFVGFSASAETYTVKSGDSLSKIALKYPGVSWKDIFKANQVKIKKPSLVFPGQILHIPVKSSITPTVRYWKKPGGDKFGKERDKAKAINRFSLPAEVKSQAIEKLRNGDLKPFIIKNGDRFEEMFFGNYKMWKNVIVAWPNNQVEKGAFLKVEHKGKYYFIAYPYVCDNIAWWSKDKPKPPAPAPPPSPKPPAKIVEKTEAQKYWADADLYAWGGAVRPVHGDGSSRYWGGKGNLWLNRHTNSQGTFKEGISAIYNGWNGKSGSGFKYHGDRRTIGPVLSWLQNDGDESILSVQLGKQRDKGRSADGLYRAKQDTNILHFGVTHDTRPESGMIKKVSMYAEYNRDIGHKKTSSWNGYKIDPKNDPAGDKSTVSVGARIFTFESKNIKAGILGNYDHAFEDGHDGIQGGPFVCDDEEIICADVRYSSVTNSRYKDTNGDAVASGINIDVVKLGKKIFKFFSKKK